MADILGTLAMFASLLMVLFGFPSQIWENYKRKSTSGLDNNLIFSAFIGYTLWMLYGWASNNLFLMISQTTGWMLALVIVVQVFYYKKSK